MAISKLILNGEIQMDVTSNTNTSNNMLSGVVGTKNDGTSVTGNIVSKSSTDLTVSGATVTAPAGYYANAASKAVATTTHPNPTASITSSTGVVTASHTQTAGYVTAGTTTSTVNLTSKAAATYYPSTADQTISSYRWLTGTQTIKSVTTSNLTAANIAEGVIVKVGDANNASRITQVTGTHSGSPSYTATICTYDSFGTSGNANYCYVSYNGTKYYTLGNTFTFKEGDILTVRAYDDFYINGTNTGFDISSGFDWVLPGSDIDIYFEYDDASSSELYIRTLDLPSDSICFYRHWDDQTQSYYYTCNKTYEQCYEILSNTADVIAYVDTPTDPRMLYIGVMLTRTSDYALRFRSYRYEVTDGVRSQIIYYPDGTIEYLDTPVSIFAKIDITSNGTYTNSSRYYATINVSVQGSGFTADDIAMRTMSGDISGNATTIANYAFASCDGLTTASFPSCTSIGSSAFYGCGSLTTASFPSCTTIGSYAFASCSSLTTASFPSCTTIGKYAFAYCSSLTTASFPSCTTIGSFAFYYCGKLTTASFPLCMSIRSYTFAYCYSLSTVNFPSCTAIGSSAFYYCDGLIIASFPSCTTIGSFAFAYCYSLTTASFPSCITIGNYAFAYCSSLTTASFPSCTTIGSSAFYSCGSLLSLYLLGSSVVTLLNSNAFYYSPISEITGRIFVPSSLYNSYLTATNWSVYADRIVSV